GAMLIYAFLLPTTLLAQTPVYTAPKADIDKIKEEGLKHSQIMNTLNYLTNVIGQRLTASRNLKHANEWTRDTLTKWGLENSHLEAWGPFGRGWELERFSAQVTSPYSFPVIAYPKAWSPGFGSQVVMPVAPVAKGKKNKVATPAAAPSTTITADVVYLDAHDEAGLAKYKGQLKGKIVFMSGTRELKADFEGMGHRYNAQELLDMANAPDPDAAVRAAVPANSPNQANMQDRLK